MPFCRNLVIKDASFPGRSPALTLDMLPCAKHAFTADKTCFSKSIVLLSRLLEAKHKHKIIDALLQRYSSTK